jgi:hypothetical protein
MPNPSIVADSLHARLERYRGIYHNLSLGKSSREAALRHVREIEAELDLPEAERTPDHNGRPGGKQEPSPSDDGSLRLKRLLDFIETIDRDDDGDAMLDAVGLDELKDLARDLRK